MASAGSIDLRQLARAIFAETLAGLDAGAAVRGAVRLERGRLKIFADEFDLSARGTTTRASAGGVSADAGTGGASVGSGASVYCVGLGKAAGAMAAALDAVLGETLAGGVLSAPPMRPPLPPRWRVFEGGHPLPNEASLEAARAAFELLRRADAEGALVLFLVSGGGSAMLEWPREAATTLADLREANRVLVGCGAGIAEVNAVRCAFSAVKAGGLALAAPRSPQVTLIVSDTAAGHPEAVASGPTFPPSRRRQTPDAKEVVERYGLAARLPAPILAAVERSAASPGRDKTTDADSDELEAALTELKTRAERTSSPALPASSDAPPQFLTASDAPGPVRKYHVLLDNGRARALAAERARAHGLRVETAEELSEQNVAEGAARLVSRLLDLRARAGEGQAVCLVSGGEFACPVRGEGVGGRNSETVLRCALELEARGLAAGDLNSRAAADLPTPAAEELKQEGSPRVVALSAGTDGLDGNSPAAGALCDETTLARALALGLDPRRSLRESDAYNFFAALGDALITGPTGTNVRDLRILLAKP